jgi:hypothetical protein
VPALGCLATVLALACGAPKAAVPPSPPLLVPSPGPLVPSRSGKSSLLIIGDSLTAGITKLLPPLLPGWQLGINGYGGRSLETGLDLLAGYEFPADGRLILAMPLFTNDSPTKVRLLEQAVQESLRRVGPNGCVVWATVHRPPVKGHSYGRANRLLRKITDRRFRLVDWDRRLTEHPLRTDKTGVHPLRRNGAPGWHLRARLIARAARSC